MCETPFCLAINLVPLGLDDCSHEVELDCCSLLEVHISALKITVDFLLTTSWLVVAKIVEDVTEMRNGNIAIVILVVI